MKAGWSSGSSWIYWGKRKISWPWR